MRIHQLYFSLKKMCNPLIDAVALFSCALVMLHTRYNIVQCYIPTYAPIAIKTIVCALQYVIIYLYIIPIDT